MKGWGCRCGHAYAVHDGPCQRRLPEDLAAELPSWRCPCHGFVPAIPPQPFSPEQTAALSEALGVWPVGQMRRLSG